MNNPVIAHRQEVIDRILKGFDDEIEKSPQYIRSNRGARISPKDVITRCTKNGAYLQGKNGKEHYYSWRDLMKRKLVAGDDIVTSSGRHITKNKDKFKTLMVYTEKMKKELWDIIDSDEEFTNTKYWKQSSTTDSAYLRFKKDGVRFKVRASDHTQSSENNATIWAIKIERKIDSNKDGSIRERETWVIDTTIGKIPPKNMRSVVNTISSLWVKYNSDDEREKIKQYAEKEKMEPQSDEDVENYGHVLTLKLLDKYSIKDDALNLGFKVMEAICHKVLNSMLPDDDED